MSNSNMFSLPEMANSLSLSQENNNAYIWNKFGEKILPGDPSLNLLFSSSLSNEAVNIKLQLLSAQNTIIEKGRVLLPTLIIDTSKMEATVVAGSYSVVETKHDETEHINSFLSQNNDHKIIESDLARLKNNKVEQAKSSGQFISYGKNIQDYRSQAQLVSPLICFDPKQTEGEDYAKS